MTDEIGLFEAMYTQRAIRYIKPDPVPDELITRLLEAGVKSSHGWGQADVEVHRHQGTRRLGTSWGTYIVWGRGR